MGDDGSPTYLYVAEDAVFVIETTEADMAGQVLNALP